MISQSLRDKLKKLITMADRGTPHEAAIAAERMQSILQEHNLSRSDIEGSPDELPADAERGKQEYGQSAVYRWQRDLMETIAENNFCLHFIETRRLRDAKGKYMMWSGLDQARIPCRKVKRHVLIGRSDNVAATILMYDYLVDAMSNITPYKGKESSSTDGRLWLAGCAETLCERLKRQRTGRVKEEAVQTPGLVRLADLYGSERDLNEDIYYGYELGTTARERREEEAARLVVKEKEKELVAGGIDSDDAWYVARGEEVPDRSPQKIAKSRSRSSGGRSSSGWTQKDQAEWNRRNSSSFKAGRERGHDIGLGGSVKSGVKGEIDA